MNEVSSLQGGWGAKALPASSQPSSPFPGPEAALSDPWSRAATSAPQDWTRKPGRRWPLNPQFSTDLDSSFGSLFIALQSWEALNSKGWGPDLGLFTVSPGWPGQGQENKPGTKAKPIFPSDQGLAEWPRQYVQFQPEHEAQIQSNCGPGTPSIKRGSGSPPRAVSWLPSGLSLWNLRLTNSSFKPVWQIWVWNSGLSVSESETQMDQIQRWHCFPSFRVRSNALCGFPDSSAGKESACNAGDSGSIPGLGRSAGEGIGYPHQYSWASLVAQLVKNPPAMRETWVRSLGWEDPLEKGKATHSSVLAWRIPWTG